MPGHVAGVVREEETRRPADVLGRIAEAPERIPAEHAIGHGSDAQAAAYLECRTADGRTVFGAGIDADVATASVRAVLSAANRG